MIQTATQRLRDAEISAMRGEGSDSKKDPLIGPKSMQGPALAAARSARRRRRREV